MVSKRRRLMALVLAVMTLLSVMAVGTFGASAASGDTVYCENAKNWSSVYCYMWKEGSEDNNSKWPGVMMTKGEGNLWSYKVTGDWDMVIFNGGEGQEQTENLAYKGNGSCYNNSTKQWTTVDTPDVPTTPVDPTTPNNPVNPPTPTGGTTVYFKNTANWSKVNVYMWTDGAGENKGWPGEAAKDMGDGVWMYETDKDWKMVIFNDGSTQTDNLEFKGSDYIYDYGNGTWEFYDTSKLHIKSFTADANSPQYTGVKIKLAAVAGGGEGELSYKFSAGSTVISDFSSDSTCSWTPTTEGKYTVKVEVKDTAGNTVSKDMSFEIKDIKSEVSPVIQNIEASPSNSENTEIKKGTEATVNVTAGGGNTGTKLLFYKYTITDPKGETVNVPYYSLKNQCKFKPVETGTYSVTVSVQNSDNTTVTKTAEFDCVTEFSKPGSLTASLTVKEAGNGKYTASVTASGGTAPYTYEFKLNDEVKQAASDKATFTFDATAEGNYKVDVTVKDAEGKTVTKSSSIQVGGANDPNVKPSDPVVPELKATLAVEDMGAGIYKFTVNATGGEGAYQYKIVANGYEALPYSDKNSVTLDLSKDSTYTIVATVKDANGTEASDTKVLKISGGKLEMPLEASLVFSEEVIQGQKCVIVTVNAIGGDGNYQYECTVNGTNIRAYNSANVFAFGAPANEGDEYNIVIKVKDASGEAIESTGYAWVKDGELGYGTELPTPENPSNPTTKPSEPAGDYLKGDADLDGKVNVKDATLIQKYVAKMVDMNAQAQQNADVDGNDAINIKDATNIQKFVANLIKW